MNERKGTGTGRNGKGVSSSRINRLRHLRVPLEFHAEMSEAEKNANEKNVEDDFREKGVRFERKDTHSLSPFNELNTKKYDKTNKCREQGNGNTKLNENKKFARNLFELGQLRSDERLGVSYCSILRTMR